MEQYGLATMIHLTVYWVGNDQHGLMAYDAEMGVTLPIDLKPLEDQEALNPTAVPKDKNLHEAYLELIRREVEAAGLTLSHVRSVPVNSDILGEASAATEPDVVQLFVTGATDMDRFETDLYLIRKHIEQKVDPYYI